MNESMEIKQIREAAENYYAENLKAGDFTNSVYVAHGDGSLLSFQNAFSMIVDEALVIFTEHHGVHVYALEDLMRYGMGSQEGIEQFHGGFPPPARGWNITVNGVAWVTNKTYLSYEEVLELTGDKRFHPCRNTSVIYQGAGGENSNGSLIHEQSILIKNGTRFNVANTGSA